MRTKQGIVTSVKMNKTIVVSVHTYEIHKKYKKKFKVTKKFYAHDEQNSCVEGETVTITETRPLSKLKRWLVVEEK